MKLILASKHGPSFLLSSPRTSFTYFSLLVLILHDIRPSPHSMMQSHVFSVVLSWSCAIYARLAFLSFSYFPPLSLSLMDTIFIISLSPPPPLSLCLPLFASPVALRSFYLPHNLSGRICFPILLLSRLLRWTLSILSYLSLNVTLCPFTP